MNAFDEKKGDHLKSILFRASSPKLVEALDHAVKKLGFKSRNALVTHILKQWIEKQWWKEQADDIALRKGQRQNVTSKWLEREQEIETLRHH